MLRTERNFCSVQYSATMTKVMNNRSHAFTLTGNTLGQNNPVQDVWAALDRVRVPNFDYLIIPCVSSKQGPVASGMNTYVDGLCGETLNTDYSTIPTTVMRMTLYNLLLYLYMRSTVNG
ncbi:Uncharacterized protein FWK35_00029879 [Aphis craccivora]|uniref:CUB domain-containing protein n=1 Tax=Aphis craccivora TaxID=307492 RepID=A0A6G0Y4V1_APHCR|nr:Uncharacterized protein FWK35_00029879 [Aphis craccivora]